MRSLRTRSLVLCCLLLLGFIACGGDDDEQAPDENTATQSEASQGLTSSDLESALRNAATTQEIYFLDNQTYTTSIDDLVANELEIPEGVELSIVVATGESYCMEASLIDGGILMSLDSESGWSEIRLVSSARRLLLTATRRPGRVMCKGMFWAAWTG